MHGFVFQILYKAVYHGMKGNLMRRSNIVRLHLYPDEVSGGSSYK